MKTGILFRLFFSGVQLSLAETQSQLPHTARAGVNGTHCDPVAAHDESGKPKAEREAAQRKTIEDLLVTIILH